MSSFTPTGGWKKLKAVLNPEAFHPALAANIRKATQFNALLVQRGIRQTIQSRKYAVNATLTILIKGSMSPLVDKGQLFQSITTKMLNDYTAFVGAVRKIEGSSGKDDAVNLIQTLHEGASIPVTPHMRQLFFLLWKLTTKTLKPDGIDGRLLELYQRLSARNIVIYPLSPSTSVIHIPPRPFLKDVFEDKDILKKCKDNWAKAVKSAIYKAGG